MVLTTPLPRLVTPGAAKQLAKLGLLTAADLLRHYPRRYLDPGRMTDLTDLPEGDHVTVVALTRGVRTRDLHAGRRLLTATVSDGRRELDLAFFGKRRGLLAGRERALRPGRMALVTGVVKSFGGRPSLLHPDYQFLDEHPDPQRAVRVIEEAAWPIPVYRATTSFPSWRVAMAVQTVLEPLGEADLPDPIPSEVRERHQLPSLHAALQLIHRPRDGEEWRLGQRRFRFEEAFVLQTALAQRRFAAGTDAAVARPARDGGLRTAFLKSLPFSLTRGQQETSATITGELAGARPMQRLLQGEVGSGKTVVALLAMLQVIDAGGQAALLAPTEVLAAQHAQSIADLLGPLGRRGMLDAGEHATGIALLTGTMSAARRRSALADIASGQAGIVVGTHALLSEHVQFAELGLVVVDEQHRFGVEQRDALRGKTLAIPHQLVMTATPSPRTVAMTVFGDLEVSTLREIRAGRAGVTTYLCDAGPPAWSKRTWDLVRDEVAAGGRVFVVRPRIRADEPEADAALGPPAPAPDTGGARGTGTGTGAAPPPMASVDEVAARLRITPQLDGIEIGELHSQIPNDEREAVMADFRAGRVPVLVTTTVIEVGVDVAEATVMVIMDADRFGLSQLHQLRGRIGRGTRPAWCLAWTTATKGSEQLERLSAFAETTDGFRLAELDLAHRREGDVLGAAQHGAVSSLRLLRVLKDTDIIDAARSEARRIVAGEPGLASYPELAAAISEQLDPERADYLHRS